jgi:glycosyltransferase involved in cell wall biosynthesis
MHNAAATIGETLASVCNQTHRDLDIVVVDDGSSDGCWQTVEDAIGGDARIRLIRQVNQGVAAARNRGALETDAKFLAFVDADDLWAPEKISAQLEALCRSQHEDALVWCWYVEIDERSVPKTPMQIHPLEGQALPELANFFHLGNGSSMLMTKRVFEVAGGFDTTLRGRGAQGCEDYAFALAVAAKFPFVLVKRYLVGYRVTYGSMSGNTISMFKSWNLATGDFLKNHPKYQTNIDAHVVAMTGFWYFRSLSNGDYRSALFFLQFMLRRNKLRVVDFGVVSSRIVIKRALDRVSNGRFSHLMRSKGCSYLDHRW